MTKITGTLHEDIFKFMTISRWILLRIKNISEKIVDQMKTHFMFNNFFPQNCVLYEIMWKNMIDEDRPQMTI